MGKHDRKKPKARFSKGIVALVIMMNIVFAGAVLYVYLRVGSEPKTLIAAFFAFTTGELWFMASIKKKEIEGEGNKCNATSGHDSSQESFY